MTIKERLKSKIVWVGILAQVLLVVTVFAPDIADEVKIVFTAVIEIATFIGFLNNPTDSGKF